MLSPTDLKTFAAVRPFVVGILAVLFRLRDGTPKAGVEYFRQAEEFAAEFDRRAAE